MENEWSRGDILSLLQLLAMTIGPSLTGLFFLLYRILSGMLVVLRSMEMNVRCTIDVAE